MITPIAEPFAVGGNVTSHFITGCHELGIEHRLSSIPHPWTLRPGARMGRMLEDSITLASEDYLVQVLQQFVEDYNFRRRLKSLGGRTPYQFICDVWKRDPEIFRRDPHHDLMGLEMMPA
ncbi:MAG: hypothetical protein JF593_04180 [Novosphingobium sp.]|nr:hypothetical protein [Novosphingobium sp.]